MAIQISASDVAAASTFLETLLSEQIPDGRFTQGTPLRDITINALAFIFAQIRKDNNEIRALTSLLLAPTLSTTVDPDTDKAVGDAVDAILSNWFITRNNGNYSRGIINVYVSKYQDYILPPNTRFQYDRNRAYVPDVEDRTRALILRASQLQPVFSKATGSLDGFYFTQRVIATNYGLNYNIPPGIWNTATRFSPFVTRITNPQAFSSGTDKESTSDLISRGRTAITVRNLINDRSITTVLKEKYTAINAIQVIGYGDPEMQRDRTVETASGIDLHIGGHYDILLELPRTTATFTGALGAAYRRPDDIANIFRDDSITDWTTTAVRVGDIIRIASGLTTAPRDFTIQQIRTSELHVSVNAPFPEATEDTATFVEYFIYRPLFGADTQVLPATGLNTQGVTSATTATPNRLTLPGGARYRIVDVAVTNPDPGDVFVAPDGYVYFPVQTSNTPSAVASASELQYQIISNNPAAAQSMLKYEEVVLQPSYNGKTVRVRYETVSGLDTIDAYITDRFERVLCANPLARAFIPVYVSCSIPWKLKPTATSAVNLVNVNNAVVNYINTIDRNDLLDVSDIIQVVKDTDSNIGTVFGFNLFYDLIVPDGRIIRYSTTDIVSIDSTKVVPSAVMDTTLTDPLSLGISDRTIRYMTSAERITFQER